MSTNKKKVLSYAAAGMAGVSILAGTLSYFTDRETTDATIKTSGSDKPAVEIITSPDTSVLPDDPSLPPFEDPTPDDPSDDLTNWWEYLNTKATANFNPGDKMTLTFDMVNSGEMALDVRETFIVSSTEPFSSAPEFRLFTSYEQDGNGSHIGEEVVVQEERIDDTHYKYTIAPYILNSETEAVDGQADTELNRKYYLVFDGTAGNDFQGAVCTVDYVAEAKQHSLDGNNDWIEAATAQLTVGGQALNVVPDAQ